jgi:hypothetical protein
VITAPAALLKSLLSNNSSVEIHNSPRFHSRRGYSQRCYYQCLLLFQAQRLRRYCSRPWYASDNIDFASVTVVKGALINSSPSCLLAGITASTSLRLDHGARSHSDCTPTVGDVATDRVDSEAWQLRYHQGHCSCERYSQLWISVLSQSTCDSKCQTPSSPFLILESVCIGHICAVHCRPSRDIYNILNNLKADVFTHKCGK